MSRSYRSSPIVGNTVVSSEKTDKEIANRRLRRIVRQLLHDNSAQVVLPLRREVADVWWMGKDGKQWIGGTEYSDLLRK